MRTRAPFVMLLLSACTTGDDPASEAEALTSVSGTTAWARRIVNASPDFFSQVVADGDDGIVVYGRFVGDAIIGGFAFSAPASGDLFVARYDAQRNVTWARPLRGSDREAARAIARDSDGNLFLSGSYDGDLDVGCGKLAPGSGPGDPAAFIAKISPTGVCLWSHAYPPSPSDPQQLAGADVAGLATDPDGSVVAVGAFRGEMRFGDTVLQTNGTRGFIAKLASDGSTVWAHMYGTTDADVTEIGTGVPFEAVGTDDTGRIAVGGHVGEKTTLDLGAAGTIPENSSFVALLDSSASPIWARNLGSNVSVTALSMNPRGDIALVGGFVDADASFGRHQLQLVPFSTNTYAVVYDVTGRDLWAMPIWGVSDPTPAGVTIKANGTVYTTGTTVEGGGLHLVDERFEVPQSTHVMYMVKLNADGSGAGWKRVIGAAGASVRTAPPVVTTTGMVMTAGAFSGTVNFGTGPLVGGPNDGFVLRVYP